jgi:hypothetical protein
MHGKERWSTWQRDSDKPIQNIFIFCYFATLCSQPRHPPYRTGAPWQQIAPSPLYSSSYSVSGPLKQSTLMHRFPSPETDPTMSLRDDSILCRNLHACMGSYLQRASVTGRKCASAAVASISIAAVKKVQCPFDKGGRKVAAGIKKKGCKITVFWFSFS